MRQPPTPSPKISASGSRWVLPVLVFCLLTAVVFWLASWQEDLQNQEQETAASIESAAHTAGLRERFKLHAQFLRSLKAFAIATLVDADNLQAWQRFAQDIQVAKNLPGLLAFAYAPVIPREQAEALIDRVRRETNHPDYVIHPPLSDAAYVAPVVVIAPEGSTQRRALGFNLLSESTRRQAIEAALVSQDVALSGPMVLVFDQATRRSGFVLTQAIFRPGAPLQTLAQRRQALAGIVMIGYRADEFIDALQTGFASRFAVQVFDDGDADRGTERAPIMIFDSHPQMPVTSETQVIHRELDFGGRTWLLKFRALPYSNVSSRIDLPQLIIVAGLIGNTLLALLIFYLSTHRQRAERYALELTTDLGRSEERFRIAARGTNDGLWDQNLQTGEDHVSARVGDILGYPPHLAPQNSTEFLALLHPDDEPKRRAALKQHFEHKTPYDVELRLRNHAGDWCSMRIRGEAVRDVNQRVTRMAGSISDVTELRRAQTELIDHRDHLQDLVIQRTAKLDQALIEARAATQAKSEFLANMSHELRTPMHAILSFAELGKRRSDGASDAKIHLFFSRIGQSANRLLRLIDDLLDLSKFEAGRMELSLRPTNLLRLIDNVHRQLESLMQQNGLSFVLESCPQAELIALDTQRIEQVVHNLLSNAIKFSPHGGVIQIALSPSQVACGRRLKEDIFLPAIAIKISDSGPGIPPDELETVFGKFIQSSITKTGAGGTGLGLAICQEIVSQHRGTISAENNHGGGTSFIVTLPIESGQETP